MRGYSSATSCILLLEVLLSSIWSQDGLQVLARMTILVGVSM